MNDNYNLESTPPEGTPEYDQYMRDQFGDDYELGYRVGFGRRLGAAILDFIFTIFIYIVVMLVTGTFQKIVGFSNPLEHMAEISLIMIDTTTISTILFLIYYSTEVLYGVSLGKLILQIKIANSNRTEANTSTLLKRYFIKHLSNFISVLAALTTVFWLNGISSAVSFVIFFGFFLTLTQKRQALHDILANTAVYYKDNIKNY